MGGRGSGGRGGARGSGAAGGSSRQLSSEERVRIVDSVEKDVKSMKAPTLSNGSVMETNGLTAVVTKERNMARGGGTFYDVSVWDGDRKIFNVARMSWAQAKDTLYIRMPSMATAKAEGR